jgi:conjugal transfer pilus assembly protein TraI
LIQAGSRPESIPVSPAAGCPASEVYAPSGTSGDRPNSHAQPIAFPSVDPGFPAKPVEELLQANEDLLARIKLCYGADQASFEQDVLPLIRRYAQFVHLLPATPDNYFSEAGGLLRLGLEVGFFALQGTDGHIFSGRATITARKHLEPRWRQATFIAGLCGEIHLAMGRLLVTDVGGAQWTPYLSGLSHWLAEQRADRYFLKWLPPQGSPRALGLFALQHVVPPQTLQYLASGNAVIVPHLLASVAGMPMVRSLGGEHNVLDDLVKRAFALVVDRNLRSSADRLGRTQLGAHVERYLLDAMRRLVAGGAAWTPNTERSRLWFGEDGLYMIWPQAAADIRKLLEADQIPGIPSAPQTLAELLAQAGVVTPRTPQDIAWPIAPPPGKAIMEALRISVPELLLAGLPREPTALPQRLSPTPSASPGVTADVAASTESCDVGRRGMLGDQPDVMGAGRPAKTGSTAGVDIAEQSPVLSDPSPTSGQESGEGPGDGVAQQLSLLDDPAEPVETAAMAVPMAMPTTVPAARATRPLTFALDAPMRLDPAVRAALAEAISSMNAPRHGAASEVAACTVPTGVFVPLREFERRGVEPPTAVRLLAELSMLAGSGAEHAATGPARRSTNDAGAAGAGGTKAAVLGRTVVRDFGGTEVIGVIVRPHFIAGLDPAHFWQDAPC